jgi:DNA-binding GntR family transcriptional regulator
VVPATNASDQRLEAARGALSAGSYHSFVVRVWSAAGGGAPQFQVTHVASRDALRSRDPESVVAFMLQHLPDTDAPRVSDDEAAEA